MNGNVPLSQHPQYKSRVEILEHISGYGAQLNIQCLFLCCKIFHQILKHIPYSRYSSGGNIFVVFVVKRRTTKYLPNKSHASNNAPCACSVYNMSECRFRTEYCTRGEFL